MPTRFLATLVLLTVLAPASAAHSDPGSGHTVAYTLAPETTYDGRITALRVEINLVSDETGRTRISWPERWSGTPDLDRWARDFEVAGARLVATGPDGGHTYANTPGTPLSIRYRVVSAYDHDPTVTDARQAFPIVRPTWFSAVGEALFAAPLGRDDDPVTFTWAGVPGIGFASDLEHLQTGRVPATVADIQQSVAIGGRDLRVVGNDPAADSAGVRVATLGTYTFDLRAFTQLASDIVRAERAFWGDTGTTPFFIAMTPLRPVAGQQAMSGAGRDDGFALWLGQDQPLDQLPWLLAHEYFHHWNAARLGGLPGGPAQVRDYWLSEGVTDFYARRLLLRYGLITPQAFIDGWNETLLAYAQSPTSSASGDEVAAGFWQDENFQKQPYYRGALLAAAWDDRLRHEGQPGLDGILRRQRRLVEADPGLYPTAVAAFRAAAKPLGLDPSPEVERYVDQGDMLRLPPDAFGPCARVVTESRPAFVRGWDSEATGRADNIVTGLDPASPAYQAGLRNGMLIIERVAGVPGDSSVDYILRVGDGSWERTIRFRPAGPLVTAQRLVPEEPLAGPQGAFCAASLSGLSPG